MSDDLNRLRRQIDQVVTALAILIATLVAAAVEELVCADLGRAVRA